MIFKVTAKDGTTREFQCTEADKDFAKSLLEQQKTRNLRVASKWFFAATLLGYAYNAFIILVVAALTWKEPVCILLAIPAWLLLVKNVSVGVTEDRKEEDCGS